MEEPTDSGQPQNGSIADVVTRLCRWGTIAPQGLARVEFVSEFSRQRAVNELRERLSQSNIPFCEIELPEQTPAEQIVTDLKDKFQSLEPGVVSLSGFETAFPDDVPLLNSLRLLNFNRENLADHPLRQIWWLTPPFTQEVVQSIPDLNSWFIVKIALNETIFTSEEYLPSFRNEPHDNSLDQAVYRDAHRQSEAFVERFHNAVAQGASMLDLLGLFVAANLPFAKLGDKEGAYQLEQRLFDKLEAPNLDFKAFILSDTGNSQDKLQKATAVNYLAELYCEQGRYVEAEVLYKRALEIKEQLFGANDKMVAPTLNNLAALYVGQGRYVEAEQLYKRDFEINRRTYGPQSMPIAKDLHELGYLYVLTGRFKEAEELYVQAIIIAHQCITDVPYDELIKKYYIGLLRGLGRFREAAKLEAIYHYERLPSL